MHESERLALGQQNGSHYRTRLLEEAEAARKRERSLQSLITSEQQEWEDCDQGLIKHLVNASMNAAEHCLEMYQQVIAPGGHSGRHRHLSEEMIFVLEGSGYDLHWDPIFSAEEHYDWDWQAEPQRFDWQAGDFVFIPPYSTHQHFANSRERARIICATSRLVREMMGYEGLKQLSKASDTRGIVI